jgi:SAM domain (Sterile alpha motif)
MDVVVWLRSLGLGKYEALFRENEIDETILPNRPAACYSVAPWTDLRAANCIKYVWQVADFKLDASRLRCCAEPGYCYLQVHVS